MTSIGKTCVVSALENPLLNDAMLGLCWQPNGTLSIQAEIFPCCHGTGDMVSDHATFRCSLRERLCHAQQLLDAFRQSWPGQDAKMYFQSAKQRAPHLLQEVAAMLKGNAPQAKVSRGRKGEASPLWLTAMATIWRFGFEARVIHFPTQGRQALETLRDIRHGIPLVFVEQVTKLWDAQKAYECEGIISFAYKSNACLWMEFIQGEDNIMVQETFAQQAFSRRLDAIAKKRSPLSFLEPDSAGRLRYLTENPRQEDIPGGDEHPIFDD